MTEAEWDKCEDPAAMLEHAVHRRMSGVCRQPDRPSDRKLRLWAGAACREAHRLTGGRPGDTVKLCDLSDQYADGAIAYSALESFRPSHPDCSWPLRYQDGVHTTVMNTINTATFLPGQAALLRDVIGNPFRPATLGPICEGCYNSNDHGAAGHGNWRKAHCPRCEGSGHGPCPWLTPTVLTLVAAAYGERSRKCGKCPKWQGVEIRQGFDAVQAVIDFGKQRKACVCGGTGTTDDGTLDPARLAVLSDALEEADVPAEVTCDGCQDGSIRTRIGYMEHEACAGTGRVPHPLLAHLRSPGPHVRGCWAVDLILGRQ